MRKKRKRMVVRFKKSRIKNDNEHVLHVEASLGGELLGTMNINMDAKARRLQKRGDCKRWIREFRQWVLGNAS